MARSETRPTTTTTPSTSLDSIIPSDPIKPSKGFNTPGSYDRPLTTLGLGFDPAGVKPESGFQPVLPFSGAPGLSVPELAFNVLDTPSYDVVGERMEPMGRMTHHREDEDVAVESRNAVFASASLPFVDVGRSNKPSRSALHQKLASPTGDRGNLAVRVPAPVVPYVPPTPGLYGVTPLPQAEEPHLDYDYDYTTTEIEEQDQQVVVDKEASSADFDEFQTVKSSKRKRPRRPQLKEFRETDRIDAPTHVASKSSGNPGDHFVFDVGATMGAGSRKSPSSASVPVHRFGVGTSSAAEAAYPADLSSIDPNALLYTKHSKPYGKQYPSYVPNTIETRLSSDTVRNLPVDEDIVYGSSGGNPGAVSPEAPTSEEGLRNGVGGRLSERMRKIKSRLGMEDATDIDVIRMLRNLSGKSIQKR